MNLGEKIKTARLNLGWTQEELADRIQTTVKTIQRIESGKVKPRATTLRAISEVFQVQFEELITIRDEFLDVDSPPLNYRIILHLSALSLMIFPTYLVWICLKSKFPSMRKEAIELINFQMNLLAVMIPCGIFSILVIPVFLLVIMGLFAWVTVFINAFRIGMSEKPLYPVLINLIKSES